jgi:hypothetical protein
MHVTMGQKLGGNNPLNFRLRRRPVVPGRGSGVLMGWPTIVTGEGALTRGGPKGRWRPGPHGRTSDSNTFMFDFGRSWGIGQRYRVRTPLSQSSSRNSPLPALWSRREMVPGALLSETSRLVED